MRIFLLPVYSKLAKQGDIPAEVASLLPRDIALSEHQVQTYQALSRREVDAVINTAITGDGKSIAAYLLTLVDARRRAFAMYPTIELSRDQQKQFRNYTAIFSRTIRSEAVWGARLGELTRERSAKRRGEVLKELFNNCQVILTNPDIFNLVMNYQYGSNIFSDQELPYALANNFDDFIFDEFHVFSMPQITATIIAMLFFLEYNPGESPGFLFSSATPDPTFLQMMRRSGIKFHEISGSYSTSGGSGYRQILHQTSLALHQLKNDEDTELWLQRNLHIIIDHWQRAGQKPKGAIILNSVVTARRIARLLSTNLRSYDIKVGEVTGLVNDQQRRQVMEQADLIVGTSTIDVGIDFNISLLIFEILDAGSFLQRLGRLGRVRQKEKPYDSYEAHALFSNRVPWIYDRFVQRLQERGVSDGDSIDRPDTLRDVVTNQDVFPRATTFQPYAKRWGILQAAHVTAALENRHREFGFQTTAQALRKRYEAVFNLRDFDSSVRRYWALAGKKHSPQEQQACRTVLDEILSFRGSSPFQAAVVDTTTDPHTFIGYDILTLLQHINYQVIDQSLYTALLQERSLSEQADAIEEMHWAIRDKEGQALIIKISQFLQGRESLTLGWEGISLRDCTRQVLPLRGCYIIAPGLSEDIDILNRFLRRQLLVCYFTSKDIGEVRRKLPPHFPLYRVEQSGKTYTATFGKAALLLEAEMLRFRGKDEEQEAIFC